MIVSLYQLNLSDPNLCLMLDNVCVLNKKETLSHLILLCAQSLFLKLFLSPFLALVYLFIY